MSTPFRHEALTVTAGDLVFDARAAGPDDGPLVLLLHGFPQSSYEWRAQLDGLAAAGFRAVAPDQRGYSPGARPPDVDQYRMPHLVADVLAIADDMGGHQFHLVGHDWGAAVAWQVAGRYPERVRTLTAVSVPHPRALTSAMESGDTDQAQRSGYMQWIRQAAPGEVEEAMLGDGAARLRAMFSGLEADAVEHYVAHHSQPGALTAALNWYRASNRDDVLGIGPVAAPTLFVWSDHDAAIGPDAAQACGAHVDGPFRFEPLEGVDHWIPERAADRLNRLLVEHLGG